MGQENDETGERAMKDVFKAVRITDRVWWVGAVDWNIRDFHGYETKRGSTYNAYLVMADRIALIDTVRAPFRDEMMSRIASVVDPRAVDIIVSHHAEMDHSGSLFETAREIRPDVIYASEMGKKTLNELYHGAGDVTAVKDGEKVNLGNCDLAFYETRMLHWPDSMISWLESEKLLFSQDAFGMHLASSGRFDDEIDPAVLEYESATYFANILLPYAPLVGKALERVGAMGWDLKFIAPDHGPVWRSDLGRILGNYRRWAAQEKTRKAVIIYATMWHSTERMARAIGEGLASAGVPVSFLSMAENHRSDAAFEILEAGALIAGSPTLNNNIFPSMADVLTYLKGLRPKNLIGAAFGSYGWSGESVRQIEDMLKEMKVEIVAPGITAKHAPDPPVLEACYDLGRQVGERLKTTLP